MFAKKRGSCREMATSGGLTVYLSQMWVCQQQINFTTMLLGDSILLQEYFKLLFVLPCLCFLQCKEPVKPIPKRGVGTD